MWIKDWLKARRQRKARLKLATRPREEARALLKPEEARDDLKRAGAYTASYSADGATVADQGLPTEQFSQEQADQLLGRRYQLPCYSCRRWTPHIQSGMSYYCGPCNTPEERPE
jgi:hypothetical protein